MEHYIITGAGGYVGFAVVKELLSRGIVPRCLVNSPRSKVNLEAVGAEVFIGDITDIDTLGEIFTVDGDIYVIHSAALIAVGNKITDDLYRINVTGTQNIIQKCKEKHAHLAYIGSIEAALHKSPYIDEVRYDPEQVQGGYAKTKAMACMEVLKAVRDGLHACILLPCGVLGPYDYRRGPASHYLPIYLKYKHLPAIKGGYQVVDCRDIAFAAVEGAKRGKDGESYILSNTYHALSELFNTMRREREMSEIRHFVPTWLMKVFAYISEPIFRLFGKEPIFTAFTIKCINQRFEYSHAAATRDLGYNPRSMEETARDMVAFYVEQGCIIDGKL